VEARKERVGVRIGRSRIKPKLRTSKPA